ncbi:MAG: hypothetical protein HC880_13560 [Bacteroidia bacterium]|nr:hypothetical protein [Bacteroidia bacterium]
MKTLDGIIAALYDVISGPAGEKRNWNRMRALCKPELRLNAVGQSKDGSIHYVSMTLDEYISRNGPFFEQNGFYERELSRQTDQFGYISHVFTTYEIKFKPEGDVIMRGINSVQLIYEQGRYWIINVLWNAETPQHPLPERYLGEG